MSKSEYTHGGSFLKNLVLLLRALVNIFAFAGAGYGFVHDNMAVIAIAAALLAVLICSNLLVPYIRRK